jgi:hypothetical protein
MVGVKLRRSVCEVTVTKSLITGESAKETVKTIRVRECRVISAQPW